MRCSSCGRRTKEERCAAHGALPAPASEQAPAPLPALPELPGYSRIALLARGGFGNVYRATRQLDGLEVAIKVARADQPLAAARLEDELSALRAVGPPHVPAI